MEQSSHTGIRAGALLSRTASDAPVGALPRRDPVAPVASARRHTEPAATGWPPSSSQPIVWARLGLAPASPSAGRWSRASAASAAASRSSPSGFLR